jgi:hypothetical protein
MRRCPPRGGRDTCGGRADAGAWCRPTGPSRRPRSRPRAAPAAGSATGAPVRRRLRLGSGGPPRCGKGGTCRVRPVRSGTGSPKPSRARRACSRWSRECPRKCAERQAPEAPVTIRGRGAGAVTRSESPGPEERSIRHRLCSLCRRRTCEIPSTPGGAELNQLRATWRTPLILTNDRVHACLTAMAQTTEGAAG